MYPFFFQTASIVEPLLSSILKSPIRHNCKKKKPSNLNPTQNLGRKLIIINSSPSPSSFYLTIWEPWGHVKGLRKITAFVKGKKKANSRSKQWVKTTYVRKVGSKINEC